MPTDTIERELTIHASVDRVWELITTAEHLGTWFGDAGAEIDLRPGGTLTLRWVKHGEHRAVVETVEAPSRFAFRWAASGIGDGSELVPGRSTRVEFTLAADGDATRLRMVESGFAALDAPEEARVKAFEGNTRGWSVELGHLADHAAGVRA